MRAPILINENGDVSSFASVEDAEAYMEPVDVERGEYLVTDADGRQLSAVVITEEIPVLRGLWKSRVRKVRIVEQPAGPKP